MMYVYYSQINTLLYASHHSTLPTGNSWTCQQYNANYAYCVAVPSAYVINGSKNYTYPVVPVAAL